MKSVKIRLMSILLVLAMVIGMMPSMAQMSYADSEKSFTFTSPSTGVTGKASTTNDKITISYYYDEFGNSIRIGNANNYKLIVSAGSDRAINSIVVTLYDGADASDYNANTSNGNISTSGNVITVNNISAASVSISASKSSSPKVTSVKINYEEVPLRSVVITPGSNMTKTAESGAESQTELDGAMTDVVYNANENYKFPEASDLYTTTNGITVTRTSDTVVTVSGTPKADTAVTIPDAVSLIHNITCAPAEDGIVLAMAGEDEISQAKEGDTVTLIATADINYQLAGISVVNSSSEDVETTTVTEGEEYTFTMPESDVTVIAEFERGPVTVLVDVGAGHESLFTEEVLNNIKVEYGLESVTIEGTIITLEGVSGNQSENDVDILIWDFTSGLTDDNNRHNGEELYDIGYKPMEEYVTEDEADDDIYAESRYNTMVSDNLKYFVLWLKPFEKLELDNGSPACGKIMYEAFPTVPDGFKLDEEASHWVDENNEPVETFEAGKEYTFTGLARLDRSGSLWKYCLDPDHFTLTVDGGKDVTYEVVGRRIYMTFKATADHDWSEWTVTKEATVDAEGEETRVCKHDASHKETRAIPKLDPIVYSITEGSAQSWKHGSTSGARFTFKRSENDELTYEAFNGILVDGKAVAAGDYTATKGSVIIELKPAYLETLSGGEHTLTVQFKDADDVTVKFSVAAKEAQNNPQNNPQNNSNKSPATGDDSNMMLFAAIFALALLTAVFLYTYKKHKRA